MMSLRFQPTRRSRAVLLVGLASVTGSCGHKVETSNRPEARPSVVLIVIDTLRADGLGMYGMDLPTSPELDRLASKGVVFDRVVSQCTWTRPSVGSMLTGLYPRQLGLLTEGDEILPAESTTLAEIFQRAGYRTIGATANPHLNAFYNFHQGFDQYRDSEVGFDWMPEAAADTVLGEQNVWMATAHDLFRYLTEAVQPPAEAPFYLQVDIMDVHEFPRPAVSYGPEYDDLFGEVTNPAVRRYLQAIRATSAAVGRFVDELSSLPGFADSIFLITSDHGESFGEHTNLAPPTWHGFLVYEAQALVPAILYSPGDLVPSGIRVPDLVRLMDLMPTVLDLVGLPLPPAIEGVSLLPLLSEPGSDVGLPEAMVVETRFRGSDKLAAYGPDWKLLLHRDGHEGTHTVELQPWDVTENGAETDLAAENPSEVERLSRWLETWEREHPAAETTESESELSREEREQLRALGYLE